MITYSIGDQSRAFTTRTSISGVKARLNVLIQESSGFISSDIGKKLQGSLRVLNSINSRRVAITQYQDNAKEVFTLLERKQTAISKSQQVTKDFVDLALDQSSIHSRGVVELRATNAAEAFNTVVEQLNANIDGQSLFSGVATDRPPLIPGEDILTEVARITEGQTSAEDISETISKWFDAGHDEEGYLKFAYKGSLGDDGKRLIRISETRQTDLSGTAADPVIRDMLKGLAMAAVIDRGALPGDGQERIELLNRGRDSLLHNNSEVLAEMARIGLHQEQLEDSRAENVAALSVLDLAHLELVSVDEEITALDLKETEKQLEAMLAVTARLSRLSLMEFLR